MIDDFRDAIWQLDCIFSFFFFLLFFQFCIMIPPCTWRAGFCMSVEAGMTFNIWSVYRSTQCSIFNIKLGGRV